MAKVALLIGVSEYEHGLNPLPGAVKDVEALREVLLHPDMGGFLETNTISLNNPERQHVEELIERLFSDRQKDDLVLLYFSGHGIKDDLGRLYLATPKTRKDRKGELVRATAVAASFIQQCMGFSRARRQVVILDSCFSGAFAEGLSAKDDSIIDIRGQLGGEGRVVLTSSSSTQYSFEDQKQDLSVYTRFLIEGIKSGEADLDEDQFISVDELHEYTSQKVREFQPAMKPQIYAIREGFKIQLTKVTQGDPKQRYRKEVSRFIHQGEISFVGRRTLEVVRTSLGLETSEVKMIEDEVLEPYRKEFRKKLQQYEQVFRESIQLEYPLSDSIRKELQCFQQILEINDAEVSALEEIIIQQFTEVGYSFQQSLAIIDQELAPIEAQTTPLTGESFHQLRQQPEALLNSIETVLKSQGKAENSSAIDLIFLERCQRELAYYIGPIANFILETILAKNPQIETEQLVDLLSTEIPNPENAKQFKKIYDGSS